MKMKSYQKCCAHCPGKLVVSKIKETHECCLPKYVSGNLKISSLTKHISSYLESPKKYKAQRSGDCISRYDKFGLAKKLHAENLQHQPLPDKVDDAIFKNVNLTKAVNEISSTGRYPSTKHEANCNQSKPFHRYGPILGCKTPETKMDLAICWETPMDPVYEPQKSSHIDGSEGGVAPAIFELVQHTPIATRTCLRSDACKGKCINESFDRRKDESDQSRGEMRVNDGDRPKSIDEQGNRNCSCNCLCKNFNSIDISKSQGSDKFTKSRQCARKCFACESKRNDPRLIKSAVGIVLGTEQGKLPSKVTVPKPKTPFAKRSFRIDTLSPPFSIVNGRRDTDFPEHWRLMSVYQQSYKNPRKHKGNIRD